MSVTSLSITDQVQADATMSQDANGDSRANIYRAAKGLRSAGHLYLHQVAVTGNVTVDESTQNGTCYNITTSGADATVTLPAAASYTDKVVEVQKADTTAYAVIIDANSTELIDGALNFALYAPYASVRLYCDGVSWHIIGPRPRKIFAATAASTAYSNSSTETAYDNIGISGTLNIKANTLKAGDTIHFVLQGIATAHNGSDTLLNKLYANALILASTGAVNFTANDIWWIDSYLQIRTVGASGTCIAYGTVGFGTDGTVTAKATKLASAVIDTTAAVAITHKGTFSAITASDSARLDGFLAEFVG